jgi:hypothetical protein
VDALEFAARFWRGSRADFLLHDPRTCPCPAHRVYQHMPCPRCEGGRSCAVRERAEIAAKDIPPEQLELPLRFDR